MKVISLLLGAGLALTSIPAATAQAATGSAIEQTKKQIMAMTETIEKQEKKITDLSDDIIAVGEKIQQNEKDIEKLNQQIETTKAEADVTEQQLGDKEELYGKRLREVYKSGHKSTIGTLLGAKNLSDLLLRFKAVENIAKHDKELIDSINSLKKELDEKTKSLEVSRSKLEDTTSNLKSNQEELNQTKIAQEDELSTLKSEKTKLREILGAQEVELFADIEAILNSENSSEQEVNDALSILETIRSQVSTAEAVELGRTLTKEGEQLAKELTATRLEAERLAKEQAEAERLAKELKAKQDAEAAELAAKQAAEKEKERKVALQKAKELEKKQADQAAKVKKLAAEEKAAKQSADKARKLEEKKTSNDSLKSTNKVNKTNTVSKPAETVTKPVTKPANSETKPSSGDNNLTFNLSFYTDLPEHNGGWTITATGDKLTYGVVANNVWPLHTKIYLEGYGTMTVKDRGGASFYNRYRLDVFIPRKSGESNQQYTARIWSLGRKTVKGRIIK